MDFFKSKIQIISQYTDLIKRTWDVEISQHSDGAVKVVIPQSVEHVTHIKAHIKCPLGAQALFTVMYNLSNNGSVTVSIPYFPFARQDRIVNKNSNKELNTRDAFVYQLSKFVTSNSFNKWVFVIEDLHSSLNEAHTFPTRMVKQQNIIKSVVDTSQADFFVSVDTGMKGKLEDLLNEYSIASGLKRPIVSFTKTRFDDGLNLTLSGTSSVGEDELEGKTVFIPDDIIDYGGTVIEVAKILKEQFKVGKIITYHTHGILPPNFRALDEEGKPSRFKALLEYVDEMYIYNLWSTLEDPELKDVPENVKYFVNF
jgi:phosphoribosylpyrophosphate synthetase